MEKAFPSATVFTLGTDVMQVEINAHTQEKPRVPLKFETIIEKAEEKGLGVNGWIH